jgi:cytochrome c peroxidase
MRRRARRRSSSIRPPAIRCPNARHLLGVAAIALAIGGAASAAAPLGDGANPHPVVLVRPPAAPLSAMARLGERVFFDRNLSASRARSCADCHSPQHAFGPPGDLAVMNGGATLARPGLRAVPSLMYLERQPNFSIGPDDPESEGAPAAVATGANLVPQGGLFWDGRANTLQDQALAPLLDPNEMDGGSVAAVAAKLRRAAYAPLFATLFGPSVMRNAPFLVGEALFAVARYEIEEPAFHPYASKYDAWLEGKARFTPAEARGYRLFNDPTRANCAGCHLDQPTPDGLPPLFTDHQYEALGVPRNRKLAANRDPAFFDLGICGPARTDMTTQSRYCGMFATPTLRNVATRHVFFHNGVYHTLAQVMDFYAERDVAPQRIYPRGPDGQPQRYDDLPAAYRGNVDTADPPFDRRRGQVPAITPQDERDIIAFLRTLTDR